MKDRVNLLPFGFRRKLLFRRAAKRWGLAAALCSIVLGLMGVREYRELRLQQQGLALRQMRAEPLEMLKSHNARLAEKLKLLAERETLLGELESGHFALQLLSAVSRSAAAGDDGVHVQHLGLSRVTTRVVDKSAPEPKPGERRPETEIETLVVTVKGIGADNLAVARFVVALRDTGLFEKVDLKSSTLGADASRGVRSYIVECML